MPKADFFARFGMFVARDFIDPGVCAELLRGAPTYEWVRMAVFGIGKGLHIDETTRKNRKAELPEPFLTELKCQLAALQPAVEDHFHVKLSGFEEPSFFQWGKGSFFLPHSDLRDEPDAPDWFRGRRVSVSIHLNAPSEKPTRGTYCGGSLVLYGLPGDDRAKNCGFPLVGEPGLLIGFPSQVIHEVLPVTHGERYSIVTNYYV